MHPDIQFVKLSEIYDKQFVIPDLIRHPAFSRGPAFAGMIMCPVNYAAEIGARDDHS
jgi:hypothetical protein